MGQAASQVWGDLAKTVQTCCLNKTNAEGSSPLARSRRGSASARSRASNCSHVVDGTLIQPTEDEQILFSSVIASAAQEQSPRSDTIQEGTGEEEHGEAASFTVGDVVDPEYRSVLHSCHLLNVLRFRNSFWSLSSFCFRN